MAVTTPSIAVSPGVLSKGQIQNLFDRGSITSPHGSSPEIDASAFDLQLSTTAWQLGEGQRPSTRELAKLKANSSRIEPQKDSDGDYFLFEKKKIYLVELDHHLDLPRNINGRATGKSSIGRLDVITRLLTENSGEYDVVESGYTGSLHLLILPQTFSIKVNPGASLNQLRLFSGPPYFSIITRSLIHHYGTPFWYIQHQERPNEFRSWEELVSEYTKTSTADPNLFDLTVDLADADFNYIYKAIEQTDTATPIDLRKTRKPLNPKLFFAKTPVKSDGGARSTSLDQGSFYIMKSKERLSIPCDVAVEVVAISERIGDIRIHYAGFAHPGFGQHNNSTKPGTPLIFEVRATDMSTRLYDKSLLARIQLFKMSERTEPAKSAYDQQELKLSNVFADWPEERL